MKVILTQNIPSLGKIDDIKEVSGGYARNYLFAKNLAMPATQSLLDELGAKRNKSSKDAEKDLREQQSLADKLSGFEIDIKEKASENGQLYASINPQKIVDALKKNGFKINKSQVVAKAIKKVGEYPVKINFRHGLETEIRITVYAL
jgi:large subunit ribosomal protein L9